MSQKIKKAINLSLMTRISTEKRGKIKFTYDLLLILFSEKAWEMDPSWPYARSSALYMPLRATTPDTRNYFGQQEVKLSQPSVGHSSIHLYHHFRHHRHHFNFITVILVVAVPDAKIMKYRTGNCNLHCKVHIAVEPLR